MLHDLKASVIRFLDDGGNTVGAGFLIAERLAVTCAHVVKLAGGEPGKTVVIQFHAQSHEQQTAQVLSQGWSDDSADDVAFLQISSQWPDARPVTLSSTERCLGHEYTSLGFPAFGDYQARWPQGKLGGTVPTLNQRRPLLQLQGDEIARGCSGGPVLDITEDRVVGMITEYRDADLTRFAYAITAETLQALWPELRLLPPGYDPARLIAYRQVILERTQYVNLAGIPLPSDRSGRRIDLRFPLDRVYIRLQAAEEKRQCQQESQELGTLEKQLKDQDVGRSAHNILDTLRLLGEYFYRRGEVYQAKQRPEPVDPQAALEKHSRLVILGAPGSGKSTLLRFLARRAAEDPHGPLPLLVSLRDYATALASDSTRSLREFALRQVASGDDALRRALEAEIATGRVLWLPVSHKFYP